MTDVLRIGGVEIRPGERGSVSLPVARLHTSTELTMPVRVIRGIKPGPTLFVCAAIHGDEINGVEIIRRILRLKGLAKMSGTLILVPVVNVFGFIAHSRYLPDRRDLNRSFPGSEKGTLAARLADLFMKEVFSKSTHGIDLHTGSRSRSNFPNTRARFDDKAGKEMAVAFGAPVVLDAPLRPGSLRQAVSELKIPIMVYEGGEDLRFDEVAIKAGVRGVRSVMRFIGMLPGEPSSVQPFLAESSRWVRAPVGGIFRASARLGQRVQKGDQLGVVADPLGDQEAPVEASVAGIIIGANMLPLVNEGGQLFHIAKVGPREPGDEDPVAELLEEMGR